MKRIVTHLFLISFGLCAPIFLYETGLRIEQLISKGRSPFTNPNSRWDSQLGWSGKEHVLGKPQSPLETLVIGDSFTEGLNLPSEQMYFAQIPRSPEKKLVAYGGLGYGTLQELLVLKNYLSQQRPSQILLQLCSNDFINNSFELEKESVLQRAPAPRPYWEKGEIVYRMPRAFAGLWKFAIGYSRVANRYSQRWDQYLAEQARDGKVPTVEREIRGRGWEFDPFLRAEKITEDLLTQFVSASAGSSLYLLLVDDFEPYTKGFRDIAKKLGVPILVAPKHVQFPAEAMHEDGAHYSALGNELLGKVVAEKFFGSRKPI